jgi:hyperosmotically inducible protein
MLKIQFAVVAMALMVMPIQAGVAEESTTKFEKSQEQAPDNTSKNKRDKRLGKKTAQNQSNTKSDVALTASVRKSIMAEKGMSVDGQNVKIITQHGSITLRGPVETEAEKELIGKLAKDSGASAVTNQLEPKKP